jgi:hypothetical protein
MRPFSHLADSVTTVWLAGRARHRPNQSAARVADLLSDEYGRVYETGCRISLRTQYVRSDIAGLLIALLQPETCVLSPNIVDGALFRQVERGRGRLTDLSGQRHNGYLPRGWWKPSPCGEKYVLVSWSRETVATGKRTRNTI